jgi:hypothetical protein
MRDAITALEGAIALMQDESVQLVNSNDIVLGVVAPKAGDRHGAAWTQSEHDYLVDHWGRTPVETIASSLGRSVGSVRVRASVHKLKRQDPRRSSLSMW